MISIILSGRNDDYGGNFEGRFLTAVNMNIESLNHFGIEHEMIFVEWNPVPNKEYLSSKVPDGVKCLVIDPLIHKHLSNNKFIVFFEYFAKNIGAYHSQGDYLLFTNAEIMFGEETLEGLKNLDPDCMYRAPRVDLHNRGGTWETLKKGYASLTNPSIFKTEHDTGNAPGTNASGDFVIAHRSKIESFGGYDESIKFSSTHQDGRFVLRLWPECNKKWQILGKVYHIDHGRPNTPNRFESPIGPPWSYQNDSNYSNGPDWGFRKITEIKQEGNIVRVNLIPELIEEAKNREVPYPIIPDKFL